MVMASSNSLTVRALAASAGWNLPPTPVHSSWCFLKMRLSALARLMS
jgi:hypothetical protein